MACLFKMNKRGVFGRSKECHVKWKNAFFPRKMLFTLSQALAVAEEKCLSSVRLIR
jgi:hypothetical protein